MNKEKNLNSKGVPSLKLLCASSYRKSVNFSEAYLAKLAIPGDLKLLVTESASYQYFYSAVREIEELCHSIQANDVSVFMYTEADFNNLANRLKPVARLLVVSFLAYTFTNSKDLSVILGHPVILIPLLCFVAFSQRILPQEYFLMFALTMLSHKYNLDILALRSESERRYQEPIKAIKKLISQGVEKFEGDKNRLQILTFKLNRSQGRQEMLSTLTELKAFLQITMQNLCPTAESNDSMDQENFNTNPAANL